MQIKPLVVKTSFSLKSTPFSIESLYLLIYFIYTFSKIFNRSLFNINALSHLCKGLTIIALGVIFVSLNHTNIKRLILSMSILLLFTIVAFKNDSLSFLCSCLLIVCGRVTDFKKICKVALFASFLATIIIIIAALGGIIPNRIFTHDGAKGQALGFYFYSTYPYILMFDMLMYMYLRKQLGWIEIFVCAALNLLIYNFSSLRLTFFLGYIVLFLYIFFVKFDFIHIDKKIIRYMAFIAYPVVFFTMIWVVNTQNFHFGFWAKVNSLFNGRLQLSQTAFYKYEVPVFGQKIDMQGVQYQSFSAKEYFFIDSGYVYAILGYGIIFTCLLLLLHSILFYQSCKNNDKKLFIWIFAVLIFNIVNNMFASYDFNPLLLLILANYKEDKNSVVQWAKETKYINLVGSLTLSNV